MHIKSKRKARAISTDIGDTTRTFKFLLPQSRSLLINVLAILFSIAYDRGLFAQDIDTIASTSQTSTVEYIPPNPEVNSQAAFISSHAHVQVQRPVPMTSNVWNARLQLLCIEAGLMERYTSFSWRRGSLTVLKSQKGMTFAEDVAGHVSRHAVEAYTSTSSSLWLTRKLLKSCRQ